MTEKQKLALATFIKSFSNAAVAAEQLLLICEGVRDHRLHDNCIILFEAEVFSAETYGL